MTRKTLQVKCAMCKKKKQLVDRSEYCTECYEVLKKRVHASADRTRKEGW